MREPFPAAVEKTRRRGGPLPTQPGDRRGAFRIPTPWKVILQVLVDDGEASRWEHVSVLAMKAKGTSRIPTWDEMQFVKRLF